MCKLSGPEWMFVSAKIKAYKTLNVTYMVVLKFDVNLQPKENSIQ